MIQKTKKRLAFVFGALLVSMFGGVVQKNFDKDEALFTGINIAYADIPEVGGVPDFGGSDSGCSGSDSF